MAKLAIDDCHIIRIQTPSDTVNAFLVLDLVFLCVQQQTGYLLAPEAFFLF